MTLAFVVFFFWGGAVSSDLSVCLLVPLFVTKPPILFRAVEPKREEFVSRPGVPGEVGAGWGDGVIEGKREGGGKEREGRGLGADLGSRDFLCLHLQPGHQGQTLSSEGVLLLWGWGRDPRVSLRHGLNSQTLRASRLESWGQHSGGLCGMQ